MMGKLTPPLDVFILNLDRDTERLAAATGQFAGLQSFNVQRAAGFLASTLPPAAVRVLTGGDSRLVGACGVFLAHLGAWERIAASDAAFGLVLEDDAELVNLPRIFEVDIPEDADLVFCNDRMDPSRAEPRERGMWRQIPVAIGVEVMVPLKAARRGPPGGDAYLLSRDGARRLVAAAERDKFGGHVDWRLFRYCLDAAATRLAVHGSWLESGPLSERFSVGWNELRGYCLRPSVVRHRGVAPSSRRPIDHPE